MKKKKNLKLEQLPDRIVPAGLILDWAPAGTGVWNLAGNWINEATGVAPANPPTAFDDVKFKNTSAAACSVPTGVSVDCASITSTTWTGTLTINGTLSVDNSGWWLGTTFNSGKIVSGNNNAILNVNGGVFIYGATGLNDTVGASQLNVYINHNAIMILNGSITACGAILDTGTTATTPHVDSPGTLEVNNVSSVDFSLHSGSIFCSSIGIVDIDDSHLTNVNGVTVTGSSGLIMLTTAEVDMASGCTFLVHSGAALSEESTTGNGSTIDGNVSITNGAELTMGLSGSNYSTLTIYGNLTITDSTVSEDVNTQTANQCDYIFASTITLSNADVSVHSDSNMPTTGYHDYNLMKSSVSSFSGMFSAYTWDNYTWTASYTASQTFDVEGTV